MKHASSLAAPLSRSTRRIEVWSEKGTVRGVLAPVLDEYGVGFRVMHGFGSPTAVHDVAENYDGRTLIVLYVGDFDPSGLYMSEHDLPDRLARYGGDHVEVIRIALDDDDVKRLPSFPASDKRGDPRYKWFAEKYGNQCWELDAMDPNDLRTRVNEWIEQYLDKEAWERGIELDKAEQESLRRHFAAWRSLGGEEVA